MVSVLVVGVVVLLEVVVGVFGLLLLLLDWYLCLLDLIYDGSVCGCYAVCCWLIVSIVCFGGWLMIVRLLLGLLVLDLAFC